MVRLEFLGAMSSVGASAVLVDNEKEKIVLDYGTRVREVPPKFPIPINSKVDAVLLSHSHLDHSGGIPILTNKNHCPVYSLDVTKELTELLLLDSVKISHEEGIELPFTKKDVGKCIKSFISVKYRNPFTINNVKVTYFDAGHIPGSAMIFLEFNDKTLLYSGDFNTIDTRLIKKFDEKVPKADFLITESTYSDREHPDRKREEKNLVQMVRETIDNGGTSLISGFAISRIQEVLLILDKYGIDFPVYMDGMAKKATTIINKYPHHLANRKDLDRALEKVVYVNKDRQRKRIIKQPCVILTTSGMLNGGPIVWYLKRLFKEENCSLILTGYQMEDTPGRILLETGRFVYEDLNLEVRMRVKRFDLSAHVGRGGLFEFIEKISPEKVFCVHGDHTEEFANELKERGFDAIAPVANNRIFEI
ncbi:MAG: MBL fold metallo-hydrolase [Candidatus Aenigmatarchaeota archaeon]